MSSYQAHTAQILTAGLFREDLTRFRHIERFLKTPELNATLAAGTPNAAEIAASFAANQNFELIGTNAADADSDQVIGGGVQLSTAGADADQIILQPHQDSGQSALATIKFGTDHKSAWASVFDTGASVASVILMGGLKLTNTPVIATDAHQAFFRYEDSGNLQCVYSVGGTDYTVDSGVAVAASTRYITAIEIDDDRYVNFHINGERVHRSTVALTDAINLIPYFGVEANTAAVKTATLRCLAVAKSYTD